MAYQTAMMDSVLMTIVMEASWPWWDVGEDFGRGGRDVPDTNGNRGGSQGDGSR